MESTNKYRSNKLDKNVVKFEIGVTRKESVEYYFRNCHGNKNLFEVKSIAWLHITEYYSTEI